MPFTSGYDANFENATIRFDGEKITIYDGESAVTDALENEVFPEFIKSDNPYENEIYYFISRAKSGEFYYCPVNESVISIKTAYAELESVKHKKTIEVK